MFSSVRCINPMISIGTNQARSQKFAKGGLFGGSGGGAPSRRRPMGGVGAKPPAAGGQWGSAGEAPSCRRLGVWGQSPQPPEARGSGGGAPSARKLSIFLQK